MHCLRAGDHMQHRQLAQPVGACFVLGRQPRWHSKPLLLQIPVLHARLVACLFRWQPAQIKGPVTRVQGGQVARLSMHASGHGVRDWGGSRSAATWLAQKGDADVSVAWPSLLGSSERGAPFTHMQGPVDTAGRKGTGLHRSSSFAQNFAGPAAVLLPKISCGNLAFDL